MMTKIIRDIGETSFCMCVLLCVYGCVCARVCICVCAVCVCEKKREGEVVCLVEVNYQ